MENEETTKATRKTQWHPAFCSAVRLELRENRASLDYRNEFNLSSKPLQIDLLVIRKEKETEIANEVGRIFKGHNIMEYKSPNDSMSIDTFYKVLAYGCLYKASADHTDAIKAEDVTVSLVRDVKPVKLLNELSAEYGVREAFPGIYYVGKKALFSAQIIVTKELSEEDHTWLRSLTNSISARTAKDLVGKISSLITEGEQRLALSVLTVALKENADFFSSAKKEDGDMCEELLELMRPEMEAAKENAMQTGFAEGRAEGHTKGHAKGRIEAYYECGLTVGQIAEKMQMPQSEVEKILREPA